MDNLLVDVEVSGLHMSIMGGGRRQLAEFIGELRSAGLPSGEVADAIRARFDVNARLAWRLAHGWSQREVADRWNQRWPDEPKTAKNISYWELWPAKSGYEPSLEVLDRLAQLYQCRVTDLLADRGDYRPESRPDADAARGGALRTGAARRVVAVNFDVDQQSVDDGWYVALCRGLLRLEVEPVEAIDERMIVATVDGLHELDTHVSVPRHPGDQRPEHDLEVELLYGGRLERREHPHESFFRHIIALAEPLRAGEEHRYALRHRLPPGQPIAPHFVHVPLRRLDQFDVHIRFDPQRLPRIVWRLDGVAPAGVNDPHPTGQVVTPDRFGELRDRFLRLRQGHAYGLRWEY